MNPQFALFIRALPSFLFLESLILEKCEKVKMPVLY